MRAARESRGSLPSVAEVGLLSAGVGYGLTRAPEGSPANGAGGWLLALGVLLVVGRVVRWVQRNRGELAWRAGEGGLVLLLVGGAGSQLRPDVPGQRFWPWLVLAGLVLLLGVGVVVRRGRLHGGLAARWSRRARRNDGVASRWQVLRSGSSLPLRRKAATLRPSLRDAPWWRRWQVSAYELGTPVATVGRLRVWSPIEDVTLRLGGPRTGKTGELACRILDAPGAVITTSTRTDLVELTGPVRALRGPVRVFNPSGLGGLASTVTFDPLSGCERPKTATDRAADLLAGVSAPGGGGDREFWAGQARRVLAALLHAAALDGGSMRDVQDWVSTPDAHAATITRALRRSPEPAVEADADQFLGTNDRTRSSITSTIMPALGWLTDTTAVAATVPQYDGDDGGFGGSFDVAELLASHGTVYLLGAEDAQVAPLVTALTGHIAREARAIAALQPGGRLDPPLTMALDEAALICPIPLDSWTADMGGRNVTIHIAAQSRAQLRQRWGDTGAAAILNNAATVLVYGGTRDPDDLQAYSTLTGERDEPVASLDPDGNLHTTSTRRVPVLAPAQIAQLPARHVVVIRRGMPPAVGRVQMAWTRYDVKYLARMRRRAETARRWAQRRQQWADQLRPALEEARARLADLAARIVERAERLRARRAKAGAGDVGDVGGVRGRGAR